MGQLTLSQLHTEAKHVSAVDVLVNCPLLKPVPEETVRLKVLGRPLVEGDRKTLFVLSPEGGFLIRILETGS
jgi:hypothetical protein